MNDWLKARKQAASRRRRVIFNNDGDDVFLAETPTPESFLAARTTGIEGNHVAIVKKPADKGCRILSISVDRGERNCMTWKVEPKQHEKNQEATAATDARTKRDSSPMKALHATACISRS